MREQFIEFCKKQGRKKYQFGDVFNCALAQFGRSIYGDRFGSAGALGFWVEGEGRFEVLTYEDADAITGSKTFASLAKALEARNVPA